MTDKQDITTLTNPIEIIALIEADTQAQENQPMNDKEDKPTAPTPEPHPYADSLSAIFDAIFTLITPRIEAMVEEKVTRILSTKATLHVLDETLKEQISEQIGRAMDAHLYEYDHDVYGRYDRRLDGIESTLENMPSEETIRDMAETAAINALEDFDMTEKIEEALDNYDMDDKLTEALDNREDIVTVDTLRDALSNVTINMNNY